MAENRRSGKLAVILHADIAGSTELVQQDEHLAHERIQDTFQRFSGTIEKYHGRVRELRGDALLAEFERASDAVSATLAFQAVQAAYIETLIDNIRPIVRVGIAMGEVIIADNTVTGAGVVLAQRVEQIAEPGQLCITAAIHEAIPHRMPFDQENLGEKQVKGFDEPIRVYRVGLSAGESIPFAQESYQQEAPPKYRKLVIAVTAAVLAIVGGTTYWFKPWIPKEDPASIERMAYPLPDKPSIAVLPFDNLSGGPEKNYFVDGFTEDIITELSQFSELFVIAKSSTFTYRDKHVKIRQIAEELGVRYILDGSVRISETDLIVTAQLVNAPSGKNIWAERYERPLTEFHTIQADVLDKIVSTVVERVESVGLRIASRKQTENLSAYEHVLQGYDLVFRWNKENNEQARMHFKQAIELDPHYSRAYSGLAFTHNVDFGRGWADLEVSLDKARKASLRAISLNNSDNRPHVTLGWAYINDGQLDKGVAELNKGISLNPNDSGVLARSGYALIYYGEFQQAIDQVERAMRINPYHPGYYYDVLAWAQYFLQRYDDALRTMSHVTEPNMAQHRTLAAIYARLGKMDKAKYHAKKILELDPDFVLSNYAKTQPFKYPEHLEFHLESLRLAGLPDNPPLELKDAPSIAVLPFTNMSSDPEQEYFADGMTEDLITDISKISSLDVIARHSTFSYKGQAPDVREVGRDLGASHVIEGSVRKAGNTIRITIQLINALDGKHVWAERYDRELKDVFAIQDEVIREIISVLSLTLTPEEEVRIVKRGTENLEAYDLYMRGRQQEGFFSKESNMEAKRYYEQAIALDPNFAEAWAHLAQIHTLDGQFGWVDDIVAADKRALELVEKSIELDPNIPATRFAYSRILARNSIGQHNRAIAEAKKAIELDSNYADAYAFLGQLFILTGQAEKATEPITTAMRINPNFPFWYYYTYGFAQFFMKEYDVAVEFIEKAIDRNPNVMFVRTAFAASLAMAGRQDEAEWQIEELHGLGINKTLDELMRETSVHDPVYRALYREGLAKAGLL